MNTQIRRKPIPSAGQGPSQLVRRAAALLLAASAVWVGNVAAAEPLPAPLAAHAGQLVYLDFWASWCGPCAESFPWLNAMQAKYGDRLAIVAVNVDSDPVAAQRFLAHHPASFEISYDPEGRLAERYQIKGMPDTVILDAAGQVLHQHHGFRSEQRADYEAAIQAVLAQAPAAATTRRSSP